jgi:hypothetical protein
MASEKAISENISHNQHTYTMNYRHSVIKNYAAWTATESSPQTFVSKSILLNNYRFSGPL